MLGDLRHRAAHVHVNDVGAHAFDDLRRGGHLCRVAAEDLDGDGPFFFRVLGVLERSVDAANEPLRAHHFSDHEPAAAVALHEATERRVGHAGHGRDRKRRREIDRPDFHFQYAFTSAASTSTVTAWPMRFTESTRRAFGASFRINRPITPRSGPCTTSTIMPSWIIGHGSY